MSTNQVMKIIGGEVFILYVAFAPWILEVLVIFFPFAIFLPCPNNSSGCSFVVCFNLVLDWFLIYVLRLLYFSTFYPL